MADIRYRAEWFPSGSARMLGRMKTLVVFLITGSICWAVHAQPSSELDDKMRRIIDHISAEPAWEMGDCSFSLQLDRDGFVTSMTFERCTSPLRAAAMRFIAERMPLPADDRDGPIVIVLRKR